MTSSLSSSRRPSSSAVACDRRLSAATCSLPTVAGAAPLLLLAPLLSPSTGVTRTWWWLSRLRSGDGTLREPGKSGVLAASVLSSPPGCVLGRNTGVGAAAALPLSGDTVSNVGLFVIAADTGACNGLPVATPRCGDGRRVGLASLLRLSVSFCLGAGGSRVGDAVSAGGCSGAGPGDAALGMLKTEKAPDSVSCRSPAVCSVPPVLTLPAVEREGGSEKRRELRGVPISDAHRMVSVTPLSVACTSSVPSLDVTETQTQRPRLGGQRSKQTRSN